MDSRERQRAHFNEITPVYVQARKNPNHLLLKDLIWSSFFRQAKVRVDGRLNMLEAMCGTGEGLSIIRKHLTADVSYSGFDYSEEIVAVARSTNPGADIRQADATTYDSDGRKYDWIVLIGGLHHVYSHAQEVIHRLSSSLDRGGYFLNFEPTQNCWLTRRVREHIYNTNALFDEQSERGFELGELDGMFERARLEKVSQVYPGLLAYVLYYNPDAFPILNVGGPGLVRSIFRVDRLFWSSWIARKLSFATISLWRKP
jgi:SAM-dependent methyltransferase